MNSQIGHFYSLPEYYTLYILEALIERMKGYKLVLLSRL